ncbi:MAG: carbamoyltransferase HypF [Woeseiaceae bacterium]|nr:carbamoyltransferase HypF [Woeseiaceae bacterium]
MAEVARNVVDGLERTERIMLSGHVQGVGFRPFVYRLAKQHGLTGHVRNRLGEVEIVASGPASELLRFEQDLIDRSPPLSRPSLDSVDVIEYQHFDAFEISESSAGEAPRIFVPQDFFMCDECRTELDDPADRRYRYPFINCTQCGPRYTLIEALPYDRPNTSMAGFPLCPDCDAEYRDPADRRFHAEPVACPTCGPQLEFHDKKAGVVAATDAALGAALEKLHHGHIIAVKGIGGYHLMCDARDYTVVDELRWRKHRPAKPLAVMFPLEGEDGLDRVRQYADLSTAEAALLKSPARPIVLVAKNGNNDLARNVAPGLGEFGVFLPYSPLHALLLDSFDAPLVATSANISGEPVLTDNDEVEARIANVVDSFLHHNRPIVRPADDPVYRRVGGGMRPLRIGRGCAPVELELPHRQRVPTLAVGGHMKGTLALSWDDRVVVSPHIGEMDSPRSLKVFEQVASDLQGLYGVTAKRIVCDAHPGYTTHRWARNQELPVVTVWHHAAHASALAAELGSDERQLVFTWDGVGLGEDGTLWGGEALLGRPGDWRRVCSLQTFRLPGGDKAGREPWRSAAAMHWACGKPWADCPDSDGLAYTAWQKNLNCVETSAVGRVFDAAAALVLGRTHVSFEAEGPMHLEAICQASAAPIGMPLEKDDTGTWRADWRPLLDMLGDDNQSAALRAEVFHSSMAQLVLDQARAVRDEHGVSVVGLSGGVFQNRVLTDGAIELLRGDGFEVLLPSILPVNDAGLSYGQAAEMAARDSRG